MRVEASEDIVAEQVGRLTEQVASRVWVRRMGEREALKKDWEFWRRRERGRQDLKVALLRNELKKSGQEVVVKLEPMEVSKGEGRGELERDVGATAMLVGVPVPDDEGGRMVVCEDSVEAVADLDEGAEVEAEALADDDRELLSNGEPLS
jgi:hypothetical protein